MDAMTQPGESLPRIGEVKPKITGYRTLSEAEIALINHVNSKAEEVREMLVGIAAHSPAALPPAPRIEIDHRWLNIGQTNLQQGFMAVIRAIARPEGF